MTKETLLNILENAKDEDGKVPMSLVRKAFEKLSECKRGKWIQRPYDGIYCSECGKGWSYMISAPNNIENYSYCPHCGKRMEGGNT